MRARFRPSPALIIALIALFVSIGGVGYAASKIDTNDIKNKAVTKPKIDKQAVSANRIADLAVKTKKLADQSVTTDKLANQAVSTDKIADLAVSTGKIANQAVSTDKIADQAVNANKLAAGSVGTTAIDNGSVRAGDLGPLLLHFKNQTIPANSTHGAFLNCPAGELRISGGAFVPAGNGHGLQASWPNGSNGWSTIIRNATATAFSVQVYVLCLAA